MLFHLAQGIFIYIWYISRFELSLCIHARIQGFSSGGGVQVNPTKKSSDVFLFFFSPQLILQKSNGKFQRNLSFFKVPEGFFQGGPIAYFL